MTYLGCSVGCFSWKKSAAESESFQIWFSKWGPHR